MSKVSSAKASLGFYGKDLDTDYITNLLGCLPTEITETRRGLRGWHLRSALDQTAEFELHISSILDQLTDDIDIWRELVAAYRGRISCGVFMDNWNEGFELSPELLVRLGERNLPVGFDIYGSGNSMQDGNDLNL